MTSKTEGGGQAFPGPFQGHYGMTLRDWFAGQALAALLGGSARPVSGLSAEDYAATAYKMADALIAARSVMQGTPAPAPS